METVEVNGKVGKGFTLLYGLFMLHFVFMKG